MSWIKKATKERDGDYWLYKSHFGVVLLSEEKNDPKL